MMPTDPQIEAMNSPSASFARQREREAMEFGGPTSHWPADHPRFQEPTDAGVYHVDPSEVQHSSTYCRVCKVAYDTVGFRRRPASAGRLVPRFDRLDPEIAARLLEDFTATTANLNPLQCPRCRLLASIPIGRLAYANVAPRAVQDQPGMRLLSGNVVNKWMDTTPKPEGAIFEAGALVITSDAVSAVDASVPPAAPSRVAASRQVNGVDASRIRYGYVGRHQKGDHGDVGTYAVGLSTDPRPGMLAGRLIRNARAAETGKGDILSLYPLQLREAVSVAKGVRPAGPATLKLQTVFGAQPWETLTLVTLEA